MCVGLSILFTASFWFHFVPFVSLRGGGVLRIKAHRTHCESELCLCKSGPQKHLARDSALYMLGLKENNLKCFKKCSMRLVPQNTYMGNLYLYVYYSKFRWSDW